MLLIAVFPDFPVVVLSDCCFLVFTSLYLPHVFVPCVFEPRSCHCKWQGQCSRGSVAGACSVAGAVWQGQCGRSSVAGAVWQGQCSRGSVAEAVLQKQCCRSSVAEAVWQ